MQKDGTYSVVPRIPGGEITPAEADGDRRGRRATSASTRRSPAASGSTCSARALEQLPEIWQRLVDAGFESGQAYGKSLRTVKSCVGSTWCRYGVQDSVGDGDRPRAALPGPALAAQVQARASRGCARECAEARGKDVGVIATENGWNLYVGGNGGFQPAPRAAAREDLDDETLIRYIDRYLMYYVRTADRLQRTARWQEDLDGGLEHVREVVCEDSLGIAAELEAAMAPHVDDYRDEWAATLADPERLRRFRSFVNAPSTADPAMVKVRERGQVRPPSTEERESGSVWLAGPSIPVRGG